MKRHIGPMIRVTHVVIFFLLLVLVAIIIETISHNLYSTESGEAPIQIKTEEQVFPQFKRIGL